MKSLTASSIHFRGILEAGRHLHGARCIWKVQEDIQKVRDLPCPGRGTRNAGCPLVCPWASLESVDALGSHLGNGDPDPICLTVLL